MEPTPIVPPVVTSSNKKMTKIIIAVLALILIVIIFIMLKGKTEAPANINNSNVSATQTESKQLTSDITSATTINNEADLSAIDKQF
jgi:hypothetical protein